MSTDTRAAGSAPTPVIDAHHHVWDLSVRDQEWTRDLPALRRTFLVEHLEPHLRAAGVDGTVLVQTITVPEETPEFLALAADHDVVAGVVGWVDLTADDVADRIAELLGARGGEFLVGIRHQVQGEADPRWLVRDDVLRGLRAVEAAGLAYDLVVLAEQLPACVEAARAVPGLRFVLDHLGKPPIASGELEPWAGHVAALAALPNVACKLSGMVTEADEAWTAEQIEPYAAHVLSVFGADRVMAGSDWPVCLLRAEYAAVHELNHRLVRDLDEAQRSRVLGGTAVEWYGLGSRLAPRQIEEVAS